MIDTVEDIHAVKRGGSREIISSSSSSSNGKKRLCETYYANPPQSPSRPMRVNTKKMLRLSDSSPKIPMADSYIKTKKMKHWMIAGKDISRTGSAGIPRDIADREKKTVVWYTSCFANTIKI